MGRPKQLLPWKGRSLLRHAAETALATSLRPVFVVLGCEWETCERELAGLEVSAVINPRWSDGMGTSVAAGIEALQQEETGITGALLMLVDQPDLTVEFLDSMSARFLKGNAPIVATQYSNGGGVPAIFSRAYFEELRGLNADRGARQIIAREAKTVVLLRPPAEFADLDTPGDHATRINAMSSGASHSSAIRSGAQPAPNDYSSLNSL
jgi:molybdenum cofactor cytidylyltransferase